jgi:hypothetical protein
MLSIFQLPMQPTGDLMATSLLADGWTVYASRQSLYLAQTSWWWWWGFGDLDLTTTIHRFELGDPQQPVRYSATGTVRGWLVNQFSMSEHEGHLRVATSLVDWWWGNDVSPVDSGSRVTVLKDNGQGLLQHVGMVSGIAPGEQIVTSRFIGDTGYLVTFERIDPLFTLDLSDPTSPRVIGELEIPGFSAYLHPMDDDHLLAVGRGGNESGQVFGVAINVFDVGDLASPRLDHQLLLGNGSSSWVWSDALWDHHAFTFHRDVLTIPAYEWNDGQAFAGLVVMDVDTDAGVLELGRINHEDMPRPYWQQQAGYEYRARIRRSLYIEDNLFSLSDRGLKVSDLNHPDRLLTTVPFFPDPPSDQDK